MNKLSHILFNFSLILPLYLYYLFYLNAYSHVVISGIFIIIFSNYPDIDIKYIVSRNRKRIFYSILMLPFILYSLLMNKGKVTHRGITHSLTGLLIFSSFTITTFYMLYFYFSPINSLIANFLGDKLISLSPIFAYTFHIVGDSLTKEGIQIGKVRIRGILTTNKNDLIFTITFLILQFLASFSLIDRTIFLFMLSFALDITALSFIYIIALIAKL